MLAALANPSRRCHRLLVGPEAESRHGAALADLAAARRARGDSTVPDPTPTPAPDLARHLGKDAVHQGLALQTEPLDQPVLEELIPDPADAGARRVFVVLDQVTDPHNVGAVLRSAAAFGAAAVIAPKRHAAPESGALAKAASGALEHVPYVRVTNLARALAALKEGGVWCLGLAGDADQTLAEADPGGPVALVLGAEGPGLRRLTREACDLLARLPTGGPIRDLNVSTAAAVALYELLSRRPP